jgi:prevent-host-death family protein
MKKLELSKATSPLLEYASELNGDTVVVTKNGRPLAALISLKNTDWETLALSNNPRFIAMLERSHRRYLKEGGISPDEMRRRLKLRREKRQLSRRKAG